MDKDELPSDMEAELNRRMGAAMRQIIARDYPELYEKLSRSHPLLYGADTLDRIRSEFPQFFPVHQPKAGD